MKNWRNTFKNTFAIIGIAVTVILACSKAVDEVVAATTEPIEVILNDDVVVTDNSTSSSQESNIGKYQISAFSKSAEGSMAILNTTNGKFIIKLIGSSTPFYDMIPYDTVISEYAAQLD